ncbi:MAG: flippase-like domain-containing protein [Proteobacteria bacterium]|nr:flippase-like domain-containing protein [Pseudomonadota bacterium]MBU1389512.1 flippase-like domain-containing protein [Pseudomonadota bacterium]MBU1541332.1 flippase-like domain-containing protein [Pseudomonadota bacterium]
MAALLFFYDIDSKLLHAFDLRLFLIFIIVAVLISILGSIRLYFNLKPFYRGISFRTVHQVNIYSMLSGLYLAGIIGSTITRVSLSVVNKVNKNLFIIISVFEKVITLGFILIVGIFSFLVLSKVDFITVIRFSSYFDFVFLAVLLLVGGLFYFREFTYQLFRIVSGLLLSTSFYSLMIVLVNLIPIFLILNNLLDVSLAQKLVYTTALMFAGSLPISFQGIGVRETAAVYLLSKYNIDTSLLLGNILMVSFSSIVVISLMPLTINLFPASKKEIIEKKETIFHKSLLYIENNLGLFSIPCIALCFFEIRILFFQTQIPVTAGDFFAIVLFFVLVGSFVNKTIDILLKRMTILFFILLSYFFISFLYGWITNEPSLWGFNNRILGGLFLLGYVQAGFLFFRTDKEYIRKTFLIIFLIMTIYLLKMLFLYLSNFPLEEIPLDRIGELKSFVFSGPGLNSAATAFFLCFAMLLYLIAYHKKIISKRLLLVAAFVLSTCIGLTHSLCGIITVMIFGISWFGYNTKKQIGYVVAISTGLLFAFALFSGFYGMKEVKIETGKSRYVADYKIIKNSIIKRNISSFDSWKQDCEVSFNLLKHNWFFGVGLGGTVIEFGKSIENAEKKYNTISLYLADTGLVGVSLIGVFLLWLYSLYWRNQKDKRLVKYFFRSAVMCVGIFAIFHDISYQRIMWVWVGVYLSFIEKSVLIEKPSGL